MIEIKCEKAPIFASAINRYFASIDRISRLIVIAHDTNNQDILRLSVPLMHSIVEDVMRNLIYHKLVHENNSEILENIPIFTNCDFTRSTKFTLKDLHKYKDKSVDEVIQNSIEEYVNRLTFNNTNDISRWMTLFKIDTEKVKIHFTLIDEMFSRRHKVVHNSDYRTDRKKLDQSDTIIMDGNYEDYLNDIDEKQVSEWLNVISQFILQMIKLFLNKGELIEMKNLTHASTL